MVLETPALTDTQAIGAAALGARGIALAATLENADAPGMAEALTGLSRAPRAVIYFSGALAFGLDGEILFGAGGADTVFASQLSLESIATRLAAGGTQELVVLVEDCAGRSAGEPGALSGLQLLPRAAAGSASGLRGGPWWNL